MKRYLRIAALFVAAMLFSTSADAQWVFVARKAMGKIRQLQGEHSDVATVIIEANASDVYKKALATIKANKRLHIVKKDDASRTIAFSDGEKKAQLKVQELGEHASEILVSASPSGSAGGSSIVVESILSVCKEVQVECRVDEGQGR